MTDDHMTDDSVTNDCVTNDCVTDNTMPDGKRFRIFILVAFGFGWLLQALGMLLGGAWYQLCVLLCMFAPLLGVVVSHRGVGRARTGIGWQPNVAGHVGRCLLALWCPAALTAAGAALFFALFPGRFDGAMSAYAAQLEAAGSTLPPTAVAAISIAQAVTYVPFFNMLAAVGEESGWRGYMTPYLTRRLGRGWGLIVSGAIWGAFHWPLIVFAGYEYGTGYPLFPVSGMLVMCVSCTAIGVLLAWLYDRTGSVWAPSLAHGALNAVAGVGILFLAPGVTALLLGPTPLGLVGGIPVYALAAVALARGRKTRA